MTLRLYYHPFSSFCQKVLTALYERNVPFEGVIVDLGDPEQRAGLERLWPMAKFPVLHDETRQLALPESTSIVEYLDGAHPGPPTLIPGDAETALKVRFLDRFFDNYVEHPLQAVVKEQFRPEGARDPYGVAESKALLARAYATIEDVLAKQGGEWAAGDRFTLADCAAAPALFYANIVEPFAGHARLEAYYQRLLARPSFARAVDEARPYRKLFPLAWPESYA